MLPKCPHCESCYGTKIEYRTTGKAFLFYGSEGDYETFLDYDLAMEVPVKFVVLCSDCDKIRHDLAYDEEEDRVRVR